MRVKRIVFVNRAPFEHLDLSFENTDVVSLTGFNGSGKTTIISYIVDAFYEMARKAFENEFLGEKENKLYRISSILNNIEGKSSLVYICLSDANKEFHYADFQGEITEESFNNLMVKVGENTDGIVRFSQISNQLKHGQNYAKYVSLTDKDAHNLFENNLATYFPSYRYEQPGYLNDVYRLDLKFKNTPYFTGFLPNPIEVTTDLPEIANWMMDVVLDRHVYIANIELNNLLEKLNFLITSILATKEGEEVRIGIGERHSGGARIQIINKKTNKMVYPTIFNMSAGESSLLCLFGELIKQADRIKQTSDDVEGVVLIDEIDKHLHIRMQMFFVPVLMKMFPKVQFIISTHSTFVNIGLKDNYGSVCKIIDLNHGGIECEADKNDVFREAYEAMIEENGRFAEAYNKVYALLTRSTKPFIITEGKTDWKHIKAAMKILRVDDLNVEFYEYDSTLGDTTLVNMLKEFSKVPDSRPIVGVFDRDNFKSLDIDGLENEQFVIIGNNVYAFAIPLVHSDIYNTEEISIEHYYKREDLLKEDENHRRLFLGEEFYPKGLSKDKKYLSRSKGLDKKTKINGIIEEKVFDIENDTEEKNSLALPKDDFAQLIYNGSVYSKNFDFSSFEKIFEVIREICKDIDGDTESEEGQ